MPGHRDSGLASSQVKGVRSYIWPCSTSGDDVSSGLGPQYQGVARGPWMAASRRLASGCLGCLAERLVEVAAGQSASVVVRETAAGERDVELVLSLLEQLLPHVDGDDDAWCGPSVESVEVRTGAGHSRPSSRMPGQCHARTCSASRLAKPSCCSHTATSTRGMG